MLVAALREENAMESKRARVSSKRQVTIPRKFFEQLQIKDEVEFILKNGELIIRPFQANEVGFADLILEDLIQQGLSGNELLEAFREKQKKVRPAVERLIDEADQAVKNRTHHDITKELFEDIMGE